MDVVAIVAVSRCVVAAIAFAGAAFLAYRGKDGWGWLIFAGILAVPSTEPLLSVSAS